MLTSGQKLAVAETVTGHKWWVKNGEIYRVENLNGYPQEFHCWRPRFGGDDTAMAQALGIAIYVFKMIAECESSNKADMRKKVADAFVYGDIQALESLVYELLEGV